MGKILIPRGGRPSGQGGRGRADQMIGIKYREAVGGTGLILAMLLTLLFF
jgi:hypothetical protein